MLIVKFSEADMQSFPHLKALLEAEGITAVGGTCFTALEDGNPVALGGLIPMGGQTCEVWVSVGGLTPSGGRQLAWQCRRLLREQMRLNHWRRAQARIDPTWPLSIRFIKAMGFTKEATLRAYWYGKDRDLYAKVLP